MRGRVAHWALGVVLAVAGAALVPAPAGASVFLTVDEALELAFPGCRVERETLYLTEAQLAEARERAGEAVESAVVHPYVGWCDGRAAGVAYFDTHRVRTLPETLMVVATPEGEVERIEILVFREPTEYIPRDAWYEQFDGRGLDPELEIKRGIRPVTGATLTARATTDAVRRILALHQVARAEGLLDLDRPPGDREAGTGPEPDSSRDRGEDEP
ncbi:MAG: FMN-binding protein [Thermoanaerobaculia bacterium]